MSDTTKTHKPSFWNGWDLKTLLMLGGLIFNAGYMYKEFDTLKTGLNEFKNGTFKEFKEDTKENFKNIWRALGNKADKKTQGTREDNRDAESN